jgi:transposase
LTRYRKTQIEARGKEIQRLEKVLQDAGIKITSFSSKVLSASSRQMIEALIAGEKNTTVLADFAKTRMRKKIPQLQEALNGHFGAHHGIVAKRILAHIDFLDESIDELTKEVVNRLDPFDRTVELLGSIPGWGPRTIEVFIAETGADMTKFQTAGHLAAWAGVAPANHESAGKRKPAGTRNGTNWLRVALVEAARSAARSNGTYLSARYRRIAKRRGPNKAAVAVAHSMIIAAWHVLTNNELYQDLGADYYEKRQDPEVKVQRLVRQLESLGKKVEITSAA